jgi:zinc protease
MPVKISRRRFLAATTVTTPALLTGLGMMSLLTGKVAARPANLNHDWLFASEMFKLDNGMNVIVVPSNQAPIVCMAIVIPVGAADERADEHGVAHYLEHLMFQGTKRYPKGTFARQVTENGGAYNATTSRDVTVYYANVPKYALPRLMDIEADRLENLEINPANAARERRVVMEEYRGKAHEASNDVLVKTSPILYPNHPYARTVIGTEAEIRQLDAPAAYRFYKRNYRPGGATLILIGDVTIGEARRLVGETFGRIADARPFSPTPIPRLARPTQSELVIPHPRVSTTTVIRYYVLPPTSELSLQEANALQAFVKRVGDQSTGILFENLVRSRGLASSLSASLEANRLARQLTFAASAAPGISPKSLQAAFDDCLDKAIESGIDARGLIYLQERNIAANAFVADSVAWIRDSLISAANRSGDPARFIHQDDAAFNALRADDVNELVRTRLAGRPNLAVISIPQKS